MRQFVPNSILVVNVLCNEDLVIVVALHHTHLIILFRGPSCLLLPWFLDKYTEITCLQCLVSPNY